MTNPERILKRVKDIDDAMKELLELKRVSLEDFLESNKLQYICYASFIIISEAPVDICYHFAVKKYRIQPESFSDCFIILKEKGILPTEVAEKLVKIAKLRNLLIHRYSSIDIRKLYEYIDELEYIENFKEIALQLIDRRE